jgi:hypothetical protein
MLDERKAKIVKGKSGVCDKKYFSHQKSFGNLSKIKLYLKRATKKGLRADGIICAGASINSETECEPHRSGVKPDYTWFGGEYVISKKRKFFSCS